MCMKRTVSTSTHRSAMVPSSPGTPLRTWPQGASPRASCRRPSERARSEPRHVRNVQRRSTRPAAHSSVKKTRSESSSGTRPRQAQQQPRRPLEAQHPPCRRRGGSASNSPGAPYHSPAAGDGETHSPLPASTAARTPPWSVDGLVGQGQPRPPAARVAT